MKPNFALSLSFDGLRLMQRAEGGWLTVGDVALDDPDLTGALARLRQTGEALAGGPLQTKLLLPNEQIKYLSLDTTRAEDEDVRAALDGATPYALDDLSYAFSKGGGRTYIAAVARETLSEADAFATEHGFNPVSFAAVPEPFTYMGEPQFGAASAGAGLDIEPDVEPVAIIGAADLSSVADTMPEGRDEPAPAAPETEDVPADPAPADQMPAVSAAEEAEQSPKEQAETAPDAVEDVPAFGSRRAEGAENDASAQDKAADADALEAEPAPELEPEVLDAPGALAEPETVAEAEPDPVETAPEPPAPVFGSRREPTLSRPAASATPPQAPTLAVPTDTPAAPVAPPLSAPAAETPAPTVPVTAAMPEAPAEAPAVTGRSDAALSRQEAKEISSGLRAIREDLPTDDSAPEDAPAPSEKAGATGIIGGMFASRRMARKAAAEAEPAPAAQDDEKRRMTVFGARKPAPEKPVVGGKPRFLGLILTIILLLFLFAVAALAALNEDVISRWFGGASEAEVQVAAAPPTAPEVAVPQSNPSDEASAPLTDPAPAVDPAAPEAQDEAQAALAPIVPEEGQILTPAEAERIYAATGVWQRAPRIAVLPRIDLRGQIAAPAGFAAPAANRPGDLPDQNAVAQDPVPAPFINPPPPTAQFDFGTDGRIVATPEGTLTPEGFLVIAGRPPFEPPVRPGTVAPPQTVLDRLAFAVPEGAPVSEDAARGLIVISAAPIVSPPARPVPDVPAGQDALQAAAQPDAALVAAPDLLVVAGRPPLEPPTRPGTELPVAAAPTPGDQAAEDGATSDEGPALAGAARPAPEGMPRPPGRPGAILALANTPVLGGLTRAQAIAFRPQARPRGLAPEPEPDPAPAADPDPAPEATTEDEAGLTLNAQIAAAVQEAATRPNPFEGATQQAIAQSLRPDTRPRNMDRIVSRAAEAAARQPAPSAAPAAAQPTAPTATSVAQAATIQNAINLREINLIGVYGTPNDRRAVVRLSNGRLTRVSVGDRLDGGRVVAINDSSLIYTRRGRNVTLEIGG